MSPMLCLTALRPTDSVTEGFLPAAHRLGLSVLLLTDQPEAHRRAYAGRPDAPATIAGCAVRDPGALVDTLRRHPPVVGLLSNSDHLQVPTALAADLLGLPGKDWRAAWRAKDKAMTRERIAATGLDRVAHAVVGPGDPVPGTVPFPAVVKPRTGVASEDAFLVTDPTELAARMARIRRRRPGEDLVIEEYLPGDLHTLETLGDGRGLAVLGGWRTTLSDPPAFVEQRLDWAPAPPGAVRDAVLAHLSALGVGLGACHTEYVVHAGRVRLIEVNYRLIGDRMDLVLADLLAVPLFEHVIRLHLGEPLADLPLPDPLELPGYAAVWYPCAGRSGTLVAAPPASDTEVAGVRVVCRPLRAVGTRARWHGSNRDYLAAVHAIGPTRDRVDAALAEFSAGARWVIE